MQSIASLMSRELSKPTRLVLIFILLIIPAKILMDGYNSRHGFLDLILFGQVFEERQLDFVKQLDPDEKTPHGYDGQFYAQLAIDPLLLNKETPISSDSAPYRARRIGLPATSYIVGLGAPFAILQVYALINFAFWLLFLWVIYRYISLHTIKHFMVAFALLWSSGTLASMSRSLTDLPSAVLVVLSIFLASRPYLASSIFSYAALIKETTLVAMFSLLWPGDTKSPYRTLIVVATIIGLPLLLWFLYIRIRLSSWGGSGNPSFGMPFQMLVAKYSLAYEKLASDISIGHKKYVMWDILGLTSLIVQSIYLLIKPRTGSIVWRMGIGFALMLYVVTMPLLAEQYSYTRIFLVLTISFNLLIYQQEEKLKFLAWYIPGNIGLAWLAVTILH